MTLIGSLRERPTSPFLFSIAHAARPLRALALCLGSAVAIGLITTPVWAQDAEAGDAQAASDQAADTAGQQLPLEHPAGPSVRNVSYALGYYDGSGVKRNRDPQRLTISVEAYLEGFTAAFREEASRLGPEKSREVLEQFNRYIQGLMAEELTRRSQENADQARAVLNENRTNEGVIETASGLQYKVLESGDESGNSPDANDRFIAHFVGRMPDGSEFGNTYESGGPWGPKGLDEVIPAWREALQMMKPGDKWRLWVPPDLGYGRRGNPPRILPNQLLIFEIELVTVIDVPDDQSGS